MDQQDLQRFNQQDQQPKADEFQDGYRKAIPQYDDQLIGGPNHYS